MEAENRRLEAEILALQMQRGAGPASWGQRAPLSHTRVFVSCPFLPSRIAWCPYVWVRLSGKGLSPVTGCVRLRDALLCSQGLGSLELW